MIDRLTNIEVDKPKEECGVFGIYVDPSLANNKLVEMALGCALNNQHRGEESAGLCVSDGCCLWPPIKKMGRISSLSSDYEREKGLRGGLFGHIVIVHNRYSTTGSSNIENAAPFRFDTELGVMALGFNGNITNASQLKSELVSEGVVFRSTTDTEIIGALIVESEGNSWSEKMCVALSRLEGSFSLVASTKDSLFAARDRHGIRPLCVGFYTSEGKRCFAVSSESPALSSLHVEKMWDVTPGDLLEIKDGNVEFLKFAHDRNEAFCGLEIAYLMRPDARLRGIQMNTIRKYLGGKLAEYCPPPSKVDFVTYIPESSHSAAKGFADKLSLPYEESMIKGRYGNLNGSVRSFINPDQKNRESVAQNYFIFDVVRGKEIVLIDDSLIRGTTTGGVIKALREAGVRKVHLRIVFPPVTGFCPLGTDINEEDYLVARELKGDVRTIAEKIGVDSLGYLTSYQFSESVNKIIGVKMGLCLGCTTGKYPVEKFTTNKLIFERETK